MSSKTTTGRLLAISDLHVAYPENRTAVESLRPQSDDDWLLVAGDVGERIADVEWALGLLKERFATVVWAPGNHELWTSPQDPDQLRGEERYQRLIQVCRRLGVLTPEDPYPVWTGPGGPVTVVPLFVLYDYSFRPPGTDPGRGARPGVRPGCGVQGRASAAPAALPEPRGVVRGPGAGDGTPAGRP